MNVNIVSTTDNKLMERKEIEAEVSFDAATVACVARDLGASANAAVLSGVASNTDIATARNARAWIVDHHLGYK